MSVKRVLQERRGSWSLIGILVTTAIILIFVVYIFVGQQSSQNIAIKKQLGTVAGSTKTTVPGMVEDAAKNVACQNNLRQIRNAIDTYQSTSGGFPPSLDAAGIKTPDLMKCPLGGEPFSYDPATGTVKCTHPGHEGY